MMQELPRNKYLIATAKRKYTSSNYDDILQININEPTKHKNNLSSSEDRFDKVNGRLPMNMIVSQIARRDGKVTPTLAENTKERNENLPTFENILKQKFSNENIQPWKNKPLKSRSKKNPRIFVGPSIVDLIQSKYSKMYRNYTLGKMCVSKDLKSDVIIKQIDENPLEAAEFPYAHTHCKASKHVTWEDESPMGYIKTSEMSINDESEYTLDNKWTSPDIMDSKKLNELSPINYSVSRFHELYGKNKLPNERITLGDTNVNEKSEFCQEIFKKPCPKYERSSKYYSSEKCFLQPIPYFINKGSPEPKSRWSKYQLDESNPKKFNIIESDELLPLTCDLFKPTNYNEVCDRTELQESSFPINFESPFSSASQEKEITEILSINSKRGKLICQHDTTTPSIPEKNLSSAFNSESQEMSPKEKYTTFYITDPDDLLKTPT